MVAPKLRDLRSYLKLLKAEHEILVIEEEVDSKSPKITPAEWR